MNTKYVIVEQQQMSRRYVALRGVSFDTKQEAEAFRAKRHDHYRLFVEERTVKDIDKSQEMHCQCCNRPIHAARGTIAHHGYTRPGDGWQTPSCFGAKHLPWEVSRDQVLVLIDHLKGILARSTAACAEVAAEILPVTHHYQVYDRTVRGSYRGGTLSMTRDTFADIVKANVDDVFKHGAMTFDQFKARDLDNRERKIAQLKRDIREFTLRYEGWTQTHKREGDRWVAL